MSKSKTTAKAYTITDARTELLAIQNSVDTVLANAEKRRAEVARKLSEAGYEAQAISELFAEMGIKAGPAQTGRDIVAAKVIKVDSDYDYSELQDAMRYPKKSGVTLTALKKIVDNPIMKSAEKRTALNALIAPSTKTHNGSKGSPRDSYEIAKEQLEKIVEKVKSGKIDRKDALFILKDTFDTIKAIQETETDNN